MNQSTLSIYCTRLVVFLLLLLSIYPAFMMNAAKQNILLLAVMSISPLMLIITPKLLPQYDIPLFCMLILMIAFPFAFHFQTMRWSTLIYTSMYVCFFLSYLRILYASDINAEMFMKLIRWIIYAYAIVLIIQLGCFFTGLPIFNKINIDINHGFPRLNTLGAEPSWSARMIVLMLYVHICLSDYAKGYKQSLNELYHENKLLIFAFLFTLIMCGSTTGLFFGAIFLLRFIDLKSIFYIVVGLILITIVAEHFELSSFTRIEKFVPALLTLDEQAIIRTDGSGASRIIPTIQAFKFITLNQFESWVGYGVDYDQSVVHFPGIKANGGLFSLWINHGVIVQLLYWYIIFSICTIKKEWMSIALAIMFIAGGVLINVQMLWFLLIMFATYKYITSKEY